MRLSLSFSNYSCGLVTNGTTYGLGSKAFPGPSSKELLLKRNNISDYCSSCTTLVFAAFTPLRYWCVLAKYAQEVLSLFLRVTTLKFGF